MNDLLGPVADAWGWFGSLDPDQRRNILLLVALAIFGAFAFGMYQAHGERFVIVLPAAVIRYALLLVVLPFVLLGRLAGRGTRVPPVLAQSWTRPPDPDRAHIPARKVDPMRLPRGPLPQNEWHIFDKDWRRLYAVGVISKAGGGKDDSLAGPAIYHELSRGSADLVIMDPKLEQLVAAINGGYLPSGADVYVYGTSPVLPVQETDAFDIFALERSLTTARIITEEEGNTTHWSEKAAALIVAVRSALEDDQQEPANLTDVREVIADREFLRQLREQDPRVDNVADEDREWGYIRSTAARALEPLESPRAAALFDAERVRMPDFRSPRRQVVFLCPDAGAGEEEAKLTAAIVEVLVQLGRASGPDRIQKMVINEAASFASLKRLPQYVDIGRGEGVYLMYVLQSWSQLVRRLGPPGARNLWSGSAAQIVGQGAEPEIAGEMSAYTEPVRFTHRQPKQHRDDPGGERINEERRQALLPHHITGLRTGQWVMRVAPEVYRFEVPQRFTQTERLAAIARAEAKEKAKAKARTARR